MSKEDKESLIVSLDTTWNPYEDKNLVEGHPDEAPILNQREPFNDAIKHGDLMVGYQRNRTLSDAPRRSRPWVRLYALIALGGILLSIVWQFVRMFT